MLMHHADYDSVSPQHDYSALPAAFVERSSQSTLIIKTLLLGPMSLLVAVPLVMIGIDLIAAPASAAALTVSPIVAAQLLAALIVWTALFIVPLAKIVPRLGRSRTVSIDHDTVQLTTHGLIGKRHEIVRLASYRGVAHRVRTTLSGARHEVVLVHPMPEHSVLLAIADRIADVQVARIAATLGLAEVPARELQARRRKLPVFSVRQNQPMAVPSVG